MSTKCKGCCTLLIFLVAHILTSSAQAQPGESNNNTVTNSSQITSLTTESAPVTGPDISAMSSSDASVGIVNTTTAALTQGIVATTGAALSQGIVATTGAALTEDQMHRAEIRCNIFNQLSSERCKEIVASQTSEDDDLSQGCGRLESFKGLVTVLGCTYDDYNKLHDVICTWNGKQQCTDYDLMQRNKITEYELQLAAPCSNSIKKGVKADNPPDYCKNLIEAKDSILSSTACSSSELTNLEKLVCCSGIECFEDISTREIEVKQAISTLSSRCSHTMIVALKELAQTPERACVALESTKPALLGGNVCTEQDYASLQEVVCSSTTTTMEGTTTPDPFANEKDQRDRIQEVILNDLETKCQNFMLEEASQQISDPLEKTCKTFLDNYGFIVVGGQCSEAEYIKLKGVICGKAGAVIANVFLLIISLLFACSKTIL